MFPIELIAAALGLANVVLIARRTVLNYPFGIAMVSLYAVIFRAERLYSDALLQGFFLVLNAWGWWLWTRHRDAAGARLRRATFRFIPDAAAQAAAPSLCFTDADRSHR